MDTTAQRLHGGTCGDIHRGQCGAAALGLDPVVKLFERANGAAHSDDVVGGGQRLGQSGTKSARGACDQCSFLCHS